MKEHAIKTDSDDNSDNRLEDTVEFKSVDFVEKDLKSETESDQDGCSKKKIPIKINLGT